jgi:hypothetical protein
MSGFDAGDGEVVQYVDMSTGALEDLAAQYEQSVVEYKAHETAGDYYGHGEFHDASDVEDNGGPDETVTKYDATEDLAFLYDELGRLYQTLFDRKYPNKYAPLTAYLLREGHKRGH